VAAGEVLQRVTNESWRVFLKNRLLKPLGMTCTFTSPRELDGLRNVSTPHVLVDGQLMPDPAWSQEAGAEGFRRLQEAVEPAGAIQSNVVDMIKFVQMYLNEGVLDSHRLLQAETIREMQAPHSVM